MVEERRTIVVSSDVDETVYWGRLLGLRLEAGDVIGLIGNLGAGKTYFVKGVAEGLQVPADQPVTSPTFTLINEYQGRVTLYHFDLYRIQDAREMEGLGYEEYLYGNGVTIIEWAEKMAHLLPDDRLLIEIERESDNGRRLTLIGRGERYRMMVADLEEFEECQRYTGYRLYREEV